MKGLFIKDFCLLKNQKTFFLIIAVFAIFSLFTSIDTTFIVSYSTFIISMFTVSTLSYDEYDNGYPYLFSLPVTKKSYALSKYVFGILICSATWLMTVIISSVYQIINVKDFSWEGWLLPCFIILLIVIFLTALMIPLQLKFGGEKGKLALFGVFFGIAVSIFAIFKISEMMNFDLMGVFANILTMNKYVLFAMIGVTPFIVTPISYMFSIKILNKKEY